MKHPASLKATLLAAVAMGVWLGAGSAQAATATNTYTLGISPQGTHISGSGTSTLFVWIGQGLFPAGSILRSVTADSVKLESNPSGSWASDLGFYIDPTPLDPGNDGLLRIADDNDFGGAAEGMNWLGQGQNDGPMTVTLTAGTDFSDAIDLNTAAVMIGSAWGEATWSGKLTVTFDAAGLANIFSFGPPGNTAYIHEFVGGTNILLTVPYGTDVTALAPAYTMSPGATGDPASGAPVNFSAPQTYTVTSGDLSTTIVYTVTVKVAPPPPPILTYDFSDGTLQGWHNRVWDLSANGGAGGWVDLDPDVTAMPVTINGGEIQPPSGDDNLFGVNRTGSNQVDPIGGNTDGHLNTLWLRSPVFYPAAGGDLTVQMARGMAHGSAPADDASVSYIADGGTGWKGVALRRDSDGAFVLARPRTSEGDGMETVTFTAAELEPYIGAACTLDLINSENGGWGWLSMDNVSIPGSATPPGPPPAPTNLTATAGDAEVILEWSSAPGATAYNLKRSESSGTETTLVTIAGTSYTNTGLNNGTPYFFTVSATNSDGESADSAEVSATPSVQDVVVFWTNTTSGIWSQAFNWNPNRPVSADTGVINFNAAGTYTSTHNMGNGFLLNRLNLGGPVLTLAGDSLQFGGATPQINQNSASAVTISNALALASDTTFGGGGDGEITISGAISGSGGLTKTFSGTLTLGGASTYGGATVISAGTLRLSGRISVPNGAAVVYTFDTDSPTGPVNNSGSLGSAKNAAINNTAWGSITSGGHQGQCLTMTAADGHLRPSGNIDLSSGPTTGWTSSIWYRNLIDGGDWHTLYHGTDDAYPTIINQGTRHLNSLWGGTEDTGYTMSAGDTGWHMITTVGKVDGSTQFYIDGVAVGSPAGNRSSANIESIGARGDAAQQFAGQLDDYYFYQRALDAGEVLQLYAASLGAGGGGNDLLPTDTVLSVASSGILDLNGISQTVASLSDSGGGGGVVTNGGNAAVTLTLNTLGGTSAAFSGIIADGGVSSNSIDLVKTGGGTNIFSGANRITGSTIVSNGTLRLSGATVLTTSSIVRLFTSGGTLDLAFTGTNTVGALYIDDVNQPIGVYGNETAPITGAGHLQVAGLPPPTPTGLTATPGDGQVALSWTASLDATGYSVWSSNSVTHEVTIDTTAATSYTKTPLSNGTLYYFKVSASNNAGSSAYSAETNATPTPGLTYANWTFNDGTGADSSGNGHDLWGGGTAAPSPAGWGPSANCVIGFVTWGTIPGDPLPTDNFTLGLYVKGNHPSYTGGTQSSLFATDGDNSDSLWIGSRRVDDATDEWVVQIPGVVELAAFPVTPDTAQHIEVTRVSGVLSVMLNGAPVGTTSTATFVWGSTHVGINSGGGSSYSGCFGDITVTTPVPATPQAKILTFGPGAVINQATKAIAWTVPYGSNKSSLAPDFTLSAGAVCDHASGSTYDFTSPVEYKVISSDALITNIYAVTVTVAQPFNIMDGLAAWFDASKLGLNNGDSVDSWLDVTGAHAAGRSQGSMTFAVNQVSSLPTVQFRDNAYANLTGTLYAKEQYIVFRLPNSGDWGSVLGSQTRSGYLMNPDGHFWDGNYPAAVRQNGGAPLSPDYQLSDIGNYMVVKVTGNNGDTSVRSGWALGRQEGWGGVGMDLAEIIAFDHSLSATDEDTVGGYLATKYGITTAYPAFSPLMPYGLKATPGDAQVTLVWPAFPGATGYHVRRSTAQGGPYGDVFVASGSAYTNSGLINGTTYYYVVSATAGTETGNSAEVSATPSPVDPALSTVVAAPPAVWADGSAAAKIVVTLRKGGGLPVVGKDVTLAPEGPGTPVIAPATATTAGDGKATFTVTSSTAGAVVFTATDVTDGVVLPQTATATFVVGPPADLSVYIPESTVVETWNTSTGWDAWTKARTWSIDEAGDIVLGAPGVQEGWMEINAPSALSYVNSGMEMTFIGAPNNDNDYMYLLMVSWTNPREGFVLTTRGGGTIGETRQILADGVYNVTDWSSPANLEGLHTMAFVRHANGNLNAYVDGVLVGAMTDTTTPAAALQKIGVGNQYSGSQYLPKGTVVTQVRAFTVTPPLGPVDPDVSTVLATPSSVRADGSAFATVTVTLKDANGYPIMNKAVTLDKTSGSGAPVITTVSGTTASDGRAIFKVACDTPDVYVFTATDTTDSSLAINQTATVPFVIPGLLNVTLVVNARDAGQCSSPVSAPAGSTEHWNYPNPLLTGNGQNATGSGLVDSSGAASTVGFLLHLTSNDPWGNPALTMLKTAVFKGNDAGQGDCEITGLNPSSKYDLYIASYYGGNPPRCSGTFTTGNTTANGSPQSIDGAGASESTWVQGANYVLFQSVEPDGTGKIRFRADTTPDVLMINGFQLVENPPPAPDTPAGLAATAANQQVGLTWSPSAFASAYNVKRSLGSGGPYGLIQTVTGTNYTDNGLVNGTPYYYVVSATNPTGESADCAEVSATPLSLTPPTPTGLTAVPGSGQVALSWTASLGATGYNVLTSNSVTHVVVTSASASRTYTKTGLSNGTMYYFQVSATNNAGASAYCAAVSATPQPVLINVNYSGDPGTASMNGINSDDATARGSASRVAPAAYSGTIWNDFSTAVSAGNNLLDSSGNSTVVGVTTKCSSGPWADWTGLGTARMLKSAVLASYTEYDPVFSLTGLVPGHAYDLYIASLQHDNNKPADFQVGATVKHVENNPSGATDWLEGRNYVRFTGLIPQTDGTCVVYAKCSGSWDGIVLNGFQLRDLGPRGLNPEAIFYSFSISGAAPTINGTSITVILPVGTDVTALRPTFTTSVGATCDHVSGNAYNFSSPVHYRVTSEDTLTTTDYTVTVQFTALPVGRGLTCWYDASYGVTEDGSGVLIWADRSGNGHDATRAGSGAPTLVPNDVKSRPAVHLRTPGFPTFQWLNCAGTFFTKEQYVVVRSPNANWNGNGSFLGRTSGRASSYNHGSGTTGFWQDWIPAAVTKNGTAVVDNRSANVGFRLGTISDYMVLKITVLDANPVINHSQYQIGQNDGLGNSDMDIAEIIGFSGALSAAEEKLMGAYLANKYGIATTYPPAAPDGLVAVPGHQKVDLTWAEVYGATSYNVWSSNSVTHAVVVNTSATASYAKTGLNNGTLYYFKVSATSGAGDGAYSATVSARPAGAPTVIFFR